MNTEKYKKIIEGAYGGESNSLWSSLCYCEPHLTMKEYKMLFLDLVDFLVNSKQIEVFYPSKLWREDLDIWSDRKEEILKYISDSWLDDIVDPEDLRLTDFFYDVMPPIIWK